MEKSTEQKKEPDIQLEILDESAQQNPSQASPCPSPVKHSLPVYHSDDIVAQARRMRKEELGSQQARKGMGDGASFQDMTRYATKNELIQMRLSLLLAFFTGLFKPIYILFVTNIINAFDPALQEGDMADEITRNSNYRYITQAIAFFLMYTFYVSLLLFSEKLSIRTKVRYFEALLQRDAAFFDKNDPAELSMKLNKQVEAISQAIGEKRGAIMLTLGQLLGGMIFAFIIGWSFAFMQLLTIPFIIFGIKLQSNNVQLDFMKRLKAYSKSGRLASQALMGIKVVAAFGQEQFEIDKYDRSVVESWKIGKKQNCRLSFVKGIFICIMMTCYAYTFIVGTFWVTDEKYNHFKDRPYRPGDIMGCFFGIMLGLQKLSVIAPSIRALVEGKVAAAMVFGLVDSPAPIKFDDPAAEKPDITGHILMHNISFTYPAAEQKQVLKGVTIEVMPGQLVAIVGASGSGKSTVAQLLERFYDVEDGNGAVLVDGVDIKLINLKHLRSQVGYVGQEPVLFNTSVKENLKLEKPDATDEECIEVLKLANAFDFVMDNDEGLDLEVGIRGGKLSGGQKQRIALARAYLKKPKVLILDEATSALDDFSEEQVMKGLMQLKQQLGQLTVIKIAHKISTVKYADHVYVLNQGNLVEQGTHQSLLEQFPNGFYAALVSDEAKDPPKLNSPGPSKGPPRMSTLEKRRQSIIQLRRTSLAVQTNGQYLTTTRTANEDENLITENLPSRESHLSVNQFFSPEESKEIEVKGRKNGGPGETMLEEFKEGDKSENATRIEHPGRYSKQESGGYLSVQALTTKGNNEEGPFTTEGKESNMSTNQVVPPRKRLNLEVKVTKIADDEENESASAMLYNRKRFLAKPLLSRLSPFVSQRGLTAVTVLSFILIGVVYPSLGLMIGRCLYALFADNKEYQRSQAYKFSSLILSVTVGYFFLVFISRYFTLLIGENVTMKVRQHMYRSFLTKHMAWFDERQNNPGVLAQVLQADASNLQGTGPESLGSILQQIVTVAVAFVALFFFSWQLALICICAFPFITFSSFIIVFAQGGISKNNIKSVQLANQLQNDALSHHKTVASTGNLHLLVAQYKSYLMRSMPRIKLQSHCFAFSFAITDFLTQVAQTLIYQIGSQLVQANIGVSREDIIIMTNITSFASSAVGMQLAYSSDVIKAKESAHKILNYIQEPTKIDPVKSPTRNRLIRPNFKGEIEFKNVWFRYPTRKNEWILRGLNLHIHPNDSVAIIGDSGCGKSTLINLLLRFYDVNYGEILIDGVNIQNYNLAQLRRKFGLVMQEPHIFNCSIKDNILYGKDDATNDEVLKAAKLSNSLEFIHSEELAKIPPANPTVMLRLLQQRRAEIMPKMGKTEFNACVAMLQEQIAVEGNAMPAQQVQEGAPGEMSSSLNGGFDFFCGFGGGQLSGGQKQRVAIARALVREPQVLLLDEATSALDEESQRKVQEALEMVMQQRTTVVIAHRLTTIEKCNRVVLINNGQAVEDEM